MLAAGSVGRVAPHWVQRGRGVGAACSLLLGCASSRRSGRGAVGDLEKVGCFDLREAENLGFQC